MRRMRVLGARRCSVSVFFSSRRRHTRFDCDWSSDVCSSDLVFTTVGQRNVELVKRLGADVAIDYRSARFEDVAKDCDVVLDSAGGDTLVRCFECVKPGGVVVSIGSTPSATFARSWRLNPIIVLAISVMSRKATAAARRHNARYEDLFVRAAGEQLRAITQL